MSTHPSGKTRTIESKDNGRGMKKEEADFLHLSDEELLNEAKKNKPSPLVDSFFIGFLIGIIIFGAAATSFGFFLLVPLFLAYVMIRKSKKNKAVQKELKKRGLK